MAGHPEWYPPGQVCSPPELPAYLKGVCDLKPIVGVPSDAEVIGIHAVMHAARKASDVPGMHDPGLLMKLADHLFGVQMAKYRSRYSRIIFPSDARYTPPALPAHISVSLEPVSGAPSDEEIIKVQDAVRSYQQFSSVPSMFDPRMSMDLSQHLFDLQMARYTRLAGESQPSSIPSPQDYGRPASSARTTEQVTVTTEEILATTNNPGTGASGTGLDHAPQSAPVIHIHELMERSNQLAERLNQLLERSNELAEQPNPPACQSDHLADRFNQVLERFTRLVEQVQRPTESDHLAERFNELLDRFNQLVEQSNQPAEQSNQLAERFNELFERSNQNNERAYQLTKELIKPTNKIGDVLGNINRVLVGVQHAIIRNHKGNNAYAADCLVNEKGETPGIGNATLQCNFKEVSNLYSNTLGCRLPVVIDSVPDSLNVPDAWLGVFLHFYDIGEGLCQTESGRQLIAGRAGDARSRLGKYLSSCLG